LLIIQITVNIKQKSPKRNAIKKIDLLSKYFRMRSIDIISLSKVYGLVVGALGLQTQTNLSKLKHS
jgi:hypothetical protein